MNLYSLLDHVDNLNNNSLLLFSYGSGCCSSLIHAKIHHKPNGSGKIEVNYKSLDELEGIKNKLKK